MTRKVFFLVLSFLTFLIVAECQTTMLNAETGSGGESNNTEVPSVTPVPDDDPFPEDIFTLKLLKRGLILLHFFGALYSFAAIGIICGDYFLPSVDCICSDLNLSQDVAAATFMAFATTSPELFVILIATFLTETDIGLGAVVGSGMFNILGVATVGGLAASTAVQLDWWPLFRDGLVYVIAVCGLAIVLYDGKVTLGESIGLIGYYFVYFIIMFCNRRIRKKVKSLVKRFNQKKKNARKSTFNNASKMEEKSGKIQAISYTSANEKSQDMRGMTDLNVPKETEEDEAADDDPDPMFKAFFVHYEDRISLRRISASSRGSNLSERRKSAHRLSLKKGLEFYKRTTMSPPGSTELGLPVYTETEKPRMSIVGETPDKDLAVGEEDEKDTSCHTIFFTFPAGSLWTKFSWLTLWPISFLFYWTIPDCRIERWKRFYPITFLMCVVWIGAFCYFGTWMISIMGETFGIPDSVMGLTFLALGGSMPEAISTYIMARQGEGCLGFSNSLGGNTIDICLCLGLPWLIKCLSEGSVKIYSEGLLYNSLALILGIVVLISVGIYTKFQMNRTMGIICSLAYLIFIVVSILVELQVIQLDPAGG